MLNPEEGIRADDFYLLRQAQGSGIFTDQSDGGKMLFQQEGLTSTSTQGFQRDGSGAGKQVQYQSLLDGRANQVKDCFSHTFFHGTRASITAVPDRLPT